MPPISKAGDKPAKSAQSGAKAKAVTKAVATKPRAAGVAVKAKSTPAAASKQKPPARAGASTKRAKAGARPVLSQEQRRCYVEVAAYYIAERRGFCGGSELDDWVQAESEVDRLLDEGVLKP